MGRIVLYGLIVIALVFAGLFLYGLYYKHRMETRFPAAGGFVVANGVRLHFVEEGQGQPVVLLHGASANLRDQRAGVFPVLTDRYRVIAFDRPGHGYSERAPDDGYDPRVQARIIRAALKQLGAENAILVGHSWSGAVVTSYALEYGDELKGVLVLSGATHPWRGETSWYNRLAITPVLGPVFRYTLVPPFGEAMLPAGIERNFEPNDPVANYIEKTGIPLLFRPDHFRANAEDLALLKGVLAQQSPRYGEIETPMIIMTGDADRTVSPRIHSYPLHEAVEGSELVILDGVGHMPHHVQVDEVAAAIDRLASGRVGEGSRP